MKSSKLVISGVISVLQLTVVVLYLFGKLCIYVYKKCCTGPKATDRKAGRKTERKEDKEYEADKRWQAVEEKNEQQLGHNRKVRKAIRAEKAKEAESKAKRARIDAEYKVLM